MPEPRAAQPTRILPQLSVKRGRAAIEFYRAAFGAIEDPFGHHWEIGKPLGAWPPADGPHAAG